MAENTGELSISYLIPVINRIADSVGEAGYEGNVYFPEGEPPFIALNTDGVGEVILTVLSEENGEDFTLLCSATASFRGEDIKSAEARFDAWQETHDLTGGYLDEYTKEAELFAAIPVSTEDLTSDGLILNLVVSFIQEVKELLES
jgi:hypothetical protein